MRKKSGIWAETFAILRPVCVFLIAIAVVAVAMAVKGWQTASFMLAGVMVLMGILLVIQVHRAVYFLRRRSEMVRQAATQAERHYVDVLLRVIRAVEAREKYTGGRSERIGRLAERMARLCGLDEEKCALMKVGGQLHDIGLIAVPEAVLNTPLRLGAAEFRTLQQHSTMSYEVLKPLLSLQEVLPAILHHHERMNGTGYPNGLKGDQIPLEARILAVADAYDAMTHDRPHRMAMTAAEALKELLRLTPAGYDKACVEALAEAVNLTAQEQVAENTPVAAETPAR